VNEVGEKEEPMDGRPLTRSRARRGVQDVDDGTIVPRAVEST
jgi:hypothetical protein